MEVRIPFYPRLASKLSLALRAMEQRQNVRPNAYPTLAAFLCVILGSQLRHRYGRPQANAIRSSSTEAGFASDRTYSILQR